MNLMQLRVVREVVRQDFKLTDAAQVLHSSVCAEQANS